MKTMLKVTLVIAFVAFANTLFAAGNLKVNLVPVTGEKALVSISSLSNTNFQITLCDENGRIVYYKEISNPAENYRKIFDFSGLEPGNYKIAVVCDALTTERAFLKTRSAIQVGAEKTTLEPFFGYKDGILRCTYLNFSKEPMTLKFYDKNELVYTKNVGRNFIVTEALNLSKLEDGNYVAVLTSGDKEYSYTIDKR